MGQASTIGLDIAKRVFQAHGADATGRVVFRKRLMRAKGHCQVVGLMGAFDHAARHPLMFTLRFGRTSPAARSGRPWRGRADIDLRPSGAAAGGSGRG